MRKSVISFIIVGVLFFTCGTVFADSCVIRWWGTCGPGCQFTGLACCEDCYGPYNTSGSGWIYTSEQSKTPAAVQELCSMKGCGGYSCQYCCVWVSINGTWGYHVYSQMPYFNEFGGGGWDVFCGPETDSDGDGVMDIADNCPNVSNPNQADSNGNGIGDVCEPITTTTTTTIRPTTTVPPTTTVSTTTTAPATVVTLIDFDVFPGNSNVTLVWSTASEVDNAGFNIYRSESEDGNYTKINSSLIPVKGSSTEGSSYEFTDTDLQNRKTYYYKLEDIDLNGTSTMHGPGSAKPRLIFGIFKK